MKPSTPFSMDPFKFFKRRKGIGSQSMPSFSAGSFAFEKMKKPSTLEQAVQSCPSYSQRPRRPIPWWELKSRKELADLARKNVELNRLKDRITILHQDFKKLKGVFPPGSFHVVFSNPPYRKYLTGRINPSLEKAIARHEIKGTLKDLIRAAAYLLPTKGRCYLIYSASRAIDLLAALRHHQLEPKRLQLVHPRKGEAAKFILVESVKDGGVELKIKEPLILAEAPLPPLSEPKKEETTPLDFPAFARQILTKIFFDNHH